jgi:hypothetical protein
VEKVSLWKKYFPKKEKFSSRMGKNISQSEECFPFKENIFPKEEKFHS